MEPYIDRLYSKRLVGLTHPCPRCGGEMESTGYLNRFDLPDPPMWGIEYRCPEDTEVQVWHEVPLRPLIDSVLREAGKDRPSPP